VVRTKKRRNGGGKRGRKRRDASASRLRNVGVREEIRKHLIRRRNNVESREVVLFAVSKGFEEGWVVATEVDESVGNTGLNEDVEEDV
jgi:hypothetical protein